MLIPLLLELHRCQVKMFQLWKLVLLCGLLTGTSAALLEPLLDEDLNGLVQSVKPVLDKGLDTVENVLESKSGQLVVGGA